MKVSINKCTAHGDFETVLVVDFKPRQLCRLAIKHRPTYINEICAEKIESYLLRNNIISSRATIIEVYNETSNLSTSYEQVGSSIALSATKVEECILAFMDRVDSEQFGIVE